MTFAELYAKVADKTHRKDMALRLPGLTDDARTMINLRLGLALLPPATSADTDEILTLWPLLYFYAVVANVYEFIEEYETASYFMARWIEEADRYYITRQGSEPLVIIPVDDREAP